jgi:hypothetical protein
MAKESLGLKKGKEVPSKPDELMDKKGRVEALLGNWNFAKLDLTSPDAINQAQKAKQFLLKTIAEDPRALERPDVHSAIDVLAGLDVEFQIQNSEGSSQDGLIEGLAGEDFEGAISRDLKEAKTGLRKAEILNGLRMAIEKKGVEAENVVDERGQEFALARSKDRLAFLSLELFKDDPKNTREFLLAVSGFDGEIFDELEGKPEEKIRMVKQVKNKLKARLESITKKEDPEAMVNFGSMNVNQKKVLKKAIELLDHYEIMAREEKLEVV